MHEKPQAPGAMHASRTETNCHSQMFSSARNAFLRLHAMQSPSSRLGRRLSLPLHFASSQCGSQRFEKQDPTCEPASHASATSPCRRRKASAFPICQMMAQVAVEITICSKQHRLQRTATARDPGSCCCCTPQNDTHPQMLQNESLLNRSCNRRTHPKPEQYMQQGLFNKIKEKYF